MMQDFEKLSGRNWLQGRHLLPVMERHGRATTGTVLDLGCGNSPWLPFFVEAERFIRMDRSPADGDVIVINDILNLPLADEEVDVIILSRLLGDVPDQSALMVELARILAPGGRILVYEAISYPQHDLPNDYWRVLPAGLNWNANGAGLEVSELVYCGGYATQIAVQLNSFVIGDMRGYALTRPIAAFLRATVNLSCAVIDRLWWRPFLATDYFACISRAMKEELEK